jgi:hypothetical protein
MRTPLLIAAAALVAAALLPAAAPADDGQEELERDIQELIKQQHSANVTGDLTMEQIEERIREQSEPATPAELEALAKKIVRDVAKFRQLELKRPVAMEVATREQIVSYVDSRIREEMKDEELAGQEAALKRLGLLPEKLDMRQFLLDLYGEQVAGYYDPFKQKFFIASWMDAASQAPIMAHELTHALQDQHFNLKPFLTPIPENSDATSARQAVVEGDAVVSMFAYLQQSSTSEGGKIGPMLRSSMSSPLYPVFSSAPPYFQEALFFPYADGADFVARIKGSGGFKPVTGIYKDLPRSSEQILHPDKYTKTRDDPTEVALPLKLDGWTQVHNDVLGELVVRVMMSGFVDADRAETIAEGWDGDRYRAFQKKKGSGVRGTMIVLRTVWDTPEDAEEFFQGYVEIVPEKYAGATRKTKKADGAGFASFTTVEDGLVQIERRASEVLVVDGAPDDETAASVRKRVWGGS